MAQIIIELQNLTKVFRQGSFLRRRTITAVNNLSLKVQRGEIFALLGPNGAGKTTAISVLVGFLKPTAGSINLFSRKFTHTSIDLKRRIGYLAESPQLPEYYRVCEALQFYCSIFDIPKDRRMQVIDETLKEVGIAEQKMQRIAYLSIGQKRCLGIAIALLNNPEIVFLDEPTVYLDPLVLERVRNVFLHLKEKGTTIFMSSHILSDVERISDRFAIIKDGSLVEEGSTHELTRYKSLEEEFLEKIKKENVSPGLPKGHA